MKAGLLIAAVLGSFAAFPVLAGSCPQQNGDGSIQCAGTNEYCGSSCIAPSSEPVCTAPKTLNCGSCSCVCPSGTVDCGATCASTSLSCSPGQTPDYCAGACVGNAFVVLNPGSAQAGATNVTGNITGGAALTVAGNIQSTNGDLYMANGKAVRVDGSGVTTLNVGNWGGGATGLNMNVGTSSLATGFKLDGQSVALTMNRSSGSFMNRFIFSTAGVNNWQLGQLFTATSFVIKRISSPPDVGTTSLYIDGSDNIGIGNIQNPSSVLDMYGALTVRESNVPAVSPINQGRIYFDPSTDKFKVSENGAAYVNLVPAAGLGGSGTPGKIAKFATASSMGDSLITESGSNIGIGTAAPASTLSVGGDGLAGVGVYGSGTTRGVLGQYSAGTWGSLGNNIGGNSYGLYTRGDTAAVYAYSGSQQVTLATNAYAGYFSGNVGIGVDPPTTKLDVVSANNNAVRVTANSTTSGRVLDLGSNSLSASGDLIYGAINNNNVSNTDFLEFQSGATLTEKLRIAGSGQWILRPDNTGTNGSLWIMLGRFANGFGTAAGLDVRLTDSTTGSGGWTGIDLSSNIGAGTGPKYLMKLSTGTYDQFTVNANAWTGIGTASPAARLQVDHNGASTFGVALRLNQYQVGNSDGPKMEFYKTMTTPMNWTVGMQNGVDVSNFAISSGAGTGGFGTPRMVIDTAGTTTLYGGSLNVEYSSAEGPRLLLRNPSKAGIAGNEWAIYNMTGGYGNSLQFWNYGGAGWGSKFTITDGGDVSLLGKHAFRANDSWLRLNQDGAFTSGTHTPGNFAPGALNVGGVNGWGNPGGGNAWVAGRLSAWSKLGVGGDSVNCGYDLCLWIGNGLWTNGQVYAIGGLNIWGESSIHDRLWPEGVLANQGIPNCSWWGYSGFSFSGNEGCGDTGMFSDYDGRLRFYANGTLRLSYTMANTYAFNSSEYSDRRIKKDIQPFGDGLETLKKIRTVSFRYNGLASSPKDVKAYGVIAQEVQQVAPYAVTTAPEKLYPTDADYTDILAVDMQVLSLLSINAIKELDAVTLKVGDDGRVVIRGDLAADANLWGAGSGWISCQDGQECACPEGSYVTKIRPREQGTEMFCNGL